MVNELCASIHDLEQEQQVDQLTHSLFHSNYQKFQKVGKLLVVQDKECQHAQLLKIEENAMNEIIQVKGKTIFLDGLFHASELIPCSFPEFFELGNGDYLMALKKLKKHSSQFMEQQKDPLQGVIELDGASLEVKGISTTDNSAKIDPHLHGAILLVSGFLVFAAAKKRELRGSSESMDQFYLTLANQKFEVVHQIRESPLKPPRPFRSKNKTQNLIQLVSSNKIMSIGSESNIYFHTVDERQKKLIFVKEVKFDHSWELTKILAFDKGPDNFSCMVRFESFHKTGRQRQGGQKTRPKTILMDFDSEVNLVSQSYYKALFPLDLPEDRNLLQIDIKGEIVTIIQN